MKNRIVFIVATQYDNVGDLLINKCLIDQLSLHGEVYIDSKNVPDHFKNLLLKGSNNVFELKAITDYNFKSLSFIRLLYSNFGFTHIFRSPGPLRNGGSIKVFTKNLVIGMIFNLFKRKGVNSFLVGNDIHFKGSMDSFMVKHFSKNVAKILCRSEENVRALKKLSVNQVGYIPDMCFGYRPTQNNSCTTKAIAISFRDLEDVSYDDKIRRTIQSILESNKYDSVVFFYQVQRDYDYNKRLYMYFQEYKNVVFKEECLEWSDLSFYNRFRGFLLFEDFLRKLGKILTDIIMIFSAQQIL